MLLPVADVTVNGRCRSRPAHVTSVFLSLHVRPDGVKGGRVRVVPAQPLQSVLNYFGSLISLVAHVTACVVATLPVGLVLSKGDVSIVRMVAVHCS